MPPSILTKWIQRSVTLNLLVISQERQRLTWQYQTPSDSVALMQWSLSGDSDGHRNRATTSLNASKTQAARANAFSMRVNRRLVAALFMSRNRITPFGRTRMAAR